MEYPGADLSRVVKLADFEALARDCLDQPAFDYIAGGAADELTLADNAAAWRRRRLRPRVLVDVSRVDPSAELLGTPVSLPVGMAPVAFQHLAHPQAELAAARAAARAGVPFCLSTLSSRSIEDVARAADEGGSAPRWFQLYVHRDRERSAELVRRAEGAGYGAIVLTADLPVAGVRERDVHNRLPYPQSFGNFAPPAQAGKGLLPVVTGGLNDASLNWRDIGWLRGLTALPIVLKGVLTGEDAALAVEHDIAAVWVSNHGGRQLDRAPSTADVVAEVAASVGGRAEVYVDGGIWRGADVLTALGLGARAAFIGRPAVFALAAGGEQGVALAFELLGRELRTDMALLGVTTLGQVGSEQLLGG